MNTILIKVVRIFHQVRIANSQRSQVASGLGPGMCSSNMICTEKKPWNTAEAIGTNGLANLQNLTEKVVTRMLLAG